MWTITDGGYEGSPYGHEAPSPYCIDAETFTVERQYKFKFGDWPSEVQLNGTRDKLYWSNDAIWEMDVIASYVPVRPFLQSRNTKYYGLTDFSTIPSYFIDQASLLHGTSSVNETGGGLGGLVRLGTLPDVGEGFNAQYVQGIGSFKTFDEIARFTYGSGHWQSSTRFVYSSSPNDYKYVNRDKKVYVYD